VIADDEVFVPPEPVPPPAAKGILGSVLCTDANMEGKHFPYKDDTTYVKTVRPVGPGCEYMNRKPLSAMDFAVLQLIYGTGLTQPQFTVSVLCVCVFVYVCMCVCVCVCVYVFVCEIVYRV
jgi:hypothetical protein